MKLYAAVVDGLEILETFTKEGSPVGTVFHYVRCEPHFFYADLLVECEDFKGLLRCADAVVHAGEDMAVPVGPSVKDSAFQNGVFPAERPHLWPQIYGIVSIPQIAEFYSTTFTRRTRPGDVG